MLRDGYGEKGNEMDGRISALRAILFWTCLHLSGLISMNLFASMRFGLIIACLPAPAFHLSIPVRNLRRLFGLPCSVCRDLASFCCEWLGIRSHNSPNSVHEKRATKQTQ